MPGEVKEVDAQKLWDEVAAEREAGTPPSKDVDEPTNKAAQEDTPDTPAEEPKADDAKDESTDPKTDEPPTEDKPEAKDPFEGLSPEVRARLEEFDKLKTLVGQIPTLQQTIKTAEGRVAAMQRELDVAKNAAKSVQAAPTQAQLQAAEGDLQKWNTLKQDFPDWAEATEAFVKAKLAGLTPQQAQGLSQEQVEQLVQQRLQEAEAKATAARESALVEGKYEDWRDQVNSEAFVNWFGKQTDEVKALAASPKGRDAIKLLDTYHAATAKPAAHVQAGKEKKLSAAVTTRPDAQSVKTGKTVDEMSVDELWEYERKRNAKRGADRGLTY